MRNYLCLFIMLGISLAAYAQSGTNLLTKDVKEVFESARNDFDNLKGELYGSAYKTEKQIDGGSSLIAQPEGNFGYTFRSQKKDIGNKKEMLAKTERMLTDLAAGVPDNYVLTNYKPSELGASFKEQYWKFSKPKAIKVYVFAHPKDKDLHHNQYPYLVFVHIHRDKNIYRRDIFITSHDPALPPAHRASGSKAPLDTAYVEREFASFQEKFYKTVVVKQKVSLDIEDRSITFKPDEMFNGWLRVPLLHDIRFFTSTYETSKWRVKWELGIYLNNNDFVLPTLGPNNPQMLNHHDIKCTTTDQEYVEPYEEEAREKACGLEHLINVYNEFHRAFPDEVIELGKQQLKARDAYIKKEESKTRVVEDMPVDKLMMLAKENFKSIRTASPDKVKGAIQIYDVTDILNIPVAQSVELIYNSKIGYSELKLVYDFNLEFKVKDRVVKKINMGEGFRSSWSRVYDSNNSFVAQLLQKKNSFHFSTYSLEQCNQELLKIIKSGIENKFSGSHSLYHAENSSKTNKEDIAVLSFEYNMPSDFLNEYLSPNYLYEEQPGRFLNPADHGISNEGLYYGRLGNDYNSPHTSNLLYVYKNEVVLIQIFTLKNDNISKKYHVKFMTGNNDKLRNQVANDDVAEEFNIEKMLASAVKQGEQAFVKSKGEAYTGPEMTSGEYLKQSAKWAEEGFSKRFDELVDGLAKVPGVNILYHDKNQSKVYSRDEFGLDKYIYVPKDAAIMVIQQDKNSTPYFKIKCSKRNDKEFLKNELFVSGGKDYRELRNSINKAVDFGEVSMIFSMVNFSEATCGPNFDLRIGTNRTANENTLGYIVMTID